MRIYTFAEYYPSPYKAYYDTQFADLVEQGHDLTILAMRSQGHTVNPKVRNSRLDERTRYFNVEGLGSLRRVLPRIAPLILLDPAIAARRVRRVYAGGDTFRHNVRAVLRSLALPSVPPDLCLVNSHRTLVCLPWLRAIYPGVPVALYYYGGEPAEAGALNSRVQRAAFHDADVVFALTEYARNEAVERGCPEDRVVVLPLGFDLRDYQPSASRTYRRDGALRLVSAGRLSEGKGHHHLLEAVWRLARERGVPVRLDIIGNGPLRAAIEQAVVEKGLQSEVRLLGTLSNPELVRHLGEADALVLSSHSTPTWTETQGAVIQEALLMKALAVTTRTGGVPESIPDVMRAFCVAPEDPEALTDALHRVARLPAAEMARLGEAGRSWAARHYDITRLNRRLLSEVRALGPTGADEEIDLGAGARVAARS